VTGLSMRTLFEAHEQTILVAEGIANIRGSRASIMTAGDPLAMIFQKLTRRRFRFGDALLAKIDATEAQMKAAAAVADAVEAWVGALGFVTGTNQTDWTPLTDAFESVCDAVNKRRAMREDSVS
jgi:hypothetical protein